MAHLTADFETTTQKEDCRVWAYGICSIDNPDLFYYGNNIDECMSIFANGDNNTYYFHNLKFDGEFIINWLFKNGFEWTKTARKMSPKTFTTLISEQGQFYSIEICFARTKKKPIKCKILDSLKILPFSVEEIAKGFKLEISKLEIDYTEYREVGHKLTDNEVKYLRNDVEIVARALSVIFSQDLRKMTQGSNALYDYKETIGGDEKFKKLFPPPTYDADIRQAYKGGFTYCSPRFQNKEVGEGIVFDVNSLYPSVMYYEKLPYGEGKFFVGKYKPDKLYDIYVQMFSCEFELKKYHLPTIQLKHNSGFIPTEYVTSSNGEVITLCLTSVDLELFYDHYEVYNVTFYSGWKFKSTVGLFKNYIDKWIKVKNESTINGNASMRTLAKLMLNALYGKFALNPDVQSKIPTPFEGRIKYIKGEKETREPIYVPMGAFITAYARYKTITSAQKCYDRFMYADTDSLHLIGTDIPEGLEVDKVKLGAWKHEGTFVKAKYIRQKTYCEEFEITEKEYNENHLNKNGVHINRFSERDGKYFELKITCAGMPKNVHEQVTWDNFGYDTVFTGKLKPCHVQGGIVLEEDTFQIRQIA